MDAQPRGASGLNAGRVVTARVAAWLTPGAGWKLALGIVALAICSAFNFVYLPVGVTFSDEGRFIAEAVTLVDTGEYWTGTRRAWEMPLTAFVYAILYLLTGSESGLILSARAFQSLLLVVQAVVDRKSVV